MEKTANRFVNEIILCEKRGDILCEGIEILVREVDSISATEEISNQVLVFQLESMTSIVGIPIRKSALLRLHSVDAEVSRWRVTLHNDVVEV